MEQEKENLRSLLHNLQEKYPRFLSFSVVPRNHKEARLAIHGAVSKRRVRCCRNVLEKLVTLNALHSV